MSNVEQTLLHYAKNRGYLKVEEKQPEDISRKFKTDLSQHLMLARKHSSETVCISSAVRSPSEYLTLDPFLLDPRCAIESFNDFCKFVKESEIKDLNRMIFPTFLYLVADLREMGFEKDLDSLLEQQRDLFPEEEKQNLIQEVLSDALDTSESELPVSNGYRYRKIPKVDLRYSEYDAVHGYLMQKILSGRAASLLLRTIQKSATISEPSTAAEAIAGEADSDTGAKEVVSEDGEVLFERLQETLRRIVEENKSRPERKFPLLRFYNVTKSPSHVVCSATSSPTAGFLACGLENSEVMLWRLRSDVSLPEKSEDANQLMGWKRGTTQQKSASQSAKSAEKRPEESVRFLRAHSGPVYDLKFVPRTDKESRFLVSCSGDRTVRLYDLWTGGQNLCVYRGHSGPIWKLSVSQEPSSQYFATVSLDQTARVFSFERIYPVRILAAHQDSVDCVRFHPSGSYLATGSCDGSVLLWSLRDSVPVRLFQGFENGRGVEALAFSPDGKFLACAAENRKLYIWDVGSGELWKPPVKENWHEDRVYEMEFGGSNGECLVSGGADGTVRIEKWKDEGKVVEKLDTPAKASVLSLSFLDNYEIVCAGSSFQ